MSKTIKINAKELEKFAFEQARNVKIVASDKFADVEMGSLAAVIFAAVDIALVRDKFNLGIDVKIIKPNDGAKAQSQLIRTTPKNRKQ